MQFRDIRTSDAAISRIAAVISKGALVSGEYPQEVEELMKDVTGATEVVSVSSGTMALTIALRCMGVGNGDFVIVPDITFVGCATAVMELGAIPVFVDVDPDTFALDEDSTREEIGRFGERIKAVMAVRLGGEPVPKWVYELGVPVLLDSAHSMEPLPFTAVAAIYSFYPTKIVSGIEGGAIATNNPDFAARARRLRLFGFEQGSRIAHEAGYKGNMSNVSAALISSNLGQLSVNLASRERVRDIYNEHFGLNRLGLGMYMVLLDDPDAVTALIPAIRHYPMTLSEMLSGACVNEKARWVAKHLISLPFHEHMVDKEMEEVCSIIKPRLINHLEHYGSTFNGPCAV